MAMVVDHQKKKRGDLEIARKRRGILGTAKGFERKEQIDIRWFLGID